jgi:hypothetical protein
VNRFAVHTTEIISRTWDVEAEDGFAAERAVVYAPTSGLKPRVESRYRILSISVFTPERTPSWMIVEEDLDAQ